MSRSAIASIRFASETRIPCIMPRRGGLPRVRGWRLLRRRPRNPARCPSRGGSDRALRRARAGPRSAAGCPPDPRANGGIVIRPVTRTGARSRKAGSSSGAMPALPSSPATLTSTRISVSGVPCFSSWLSAESDATEWISSTYGRICLTLRLWSWPMKCQRKPGIGLGLGLELLGAVLAHQRQPGLLEHAQLLERDVLDRREQLDVARVAARALRGVGDLRPHALGARPHRLELEPGDQARHTTPACRPVTPPSRRWEKNRPNQHIVHSPTSWTSRTPAASSCCRATFARSRLRSPTRAS